MHTRTFLGFLGNAKKKCLCLISALLLFLALTGCGISDDDIYYYISDQTRMLTEGGSAVPSDLDYKETLYQTGVMVSDTMIALTPWIWVVSFLIGFAIKRLIKKEDKLRRDGMVLFFAIIPGLTYLLGYGFAILLNWFH